MSELDNHAERQKPKRKKRGFFSKYFGFFALVAGISSAGRPWEEEEKDDADQETGGEPPKTAK